MEIFAGLSIGALILVALFVAIKTFTLWRRTRGLPELLLGMYLLCATVLGYPLVTISTRIPPTELWLLHVGSNLVTTFGFACLMLFTLKVFRPDALWARAVVGFSLVLFVYVTVAYTIEMTGESPRPLNELVTLSLLNSAPFAFTYLWTTVESFRYHRQLRLRLRLGIGNAAVANRILLWGLMSLSAGSAVVISVIGIVVGGILLSDPMILTFSFLGGFSAICLFLAFHPPAWYRSWLERRAPVQES